MQAGFDGWAAKNAKKSWLPKGAKRTKPIFNATPLTREREV
jgi:hypothetical protein